MATPYIPYDGPVITRVEAKAAGLTRFFTGKPCKHGHLSERTTCNGGCIRCNADAIIALYYAEGEAARAVRQARSKAWKKANPETVKAAGRKYSKEHQAQAKAWKAANRDKINAAERKARQLNPALYKARSDRFTATDHSKAVRQAYYKANTEVIKRRVADWRQQNSDRVLELRQANYEANKETIKQRVREWNEANPDGSRTRGRNYRARKCAAEGSHTAAEIRALYKKQGGLCVYCSKPMDGKHEADHIQPLSRGGSNWIANIQLTCRSCNNQKRATDPLEYARRLGRLL